MKTENIIRNYLTPIYDQRKSFYEKAVVVQDENNIELYSYNTLVCTISNNQIILNKNINQKLLFSNTTLRHIKEFLKQYFYKNNVNIKKIDLVNLLNKGE